MLSKPSELERKLRSIKEPVLIIDHIQGDPDSIASKFALAYLLRRRFKLQTTVSYAKSPGQPENIYMVELFEEIYNKQIPSIEQVNLRDYGLVFLVDTNFRASNIPFSREQMEELKKKKTAIIDHHTPRERRVEIAPYFEDAGGRGVNATATRVIEFLKAFNMKLRKENKEESMLATILSHGIEIDSINRAKSRRDYEAILYIIDAIDNKLKREITSKGWPSGLIRKLGRALEAHEEVASPLTGNYALGFLGGIDSKLRHSVAKLSNELLQIPEVDAAIGAAITEGNLTLSIRTKEKCRINAEEIAAKFGGGGREGSAGASIPLPAGLSVTKEKGILDFIKKKLR